MKRVSNRECREVFAALSEFLDGTLPARTCRELEEHLRDCKPCITYLETLKKTIAACRSYRVKRPPPLAAETQEAIVGAILRNRPRGARTTRKPRHLPNKASR